MFSYLGQKFSKMSDSESILRIPRLFLIKLEKYNFGKWPQMMNKVNYFIFYEKNSACCK